MLSRSIPRIAILASTRAPGVEQLLEDPDRGRVYELAGCITTDPAFQQRRRIEAAGVPVIIQPIVQFHRERGMSLRNLRSRQEYDQSTAAILSRLDVDLVFLTSYLYILTEPMLSPYVGSIVNIHDSDLTLQDKHGQRKYVGLHATREAIFAGETETRASVHLVTDRVDEGPVVLMSDRFSVAPLASDAIRWGAYDVLKAYAFAHREWMLRAAWGPLLRRTIELIATGNVHFVRDVAWVNGMPGPCLLSGVPECQESGRPPGSCPFLRPAQHEARS